jgi:hypothetical protein
MQLMVILENILTLLTKTLVFTKGDVLEEELKHGSDSLRNWAKARPNVPDYDGETYVDACKYIENRFTDLIEDRDRPFRIQYMCNFDATIHGMYIFSL